MLLDFINIYSYLLADAQSVTAHVRARVFKFFSVLQFFLVTYLIIFTRVFKTALGEGLL